MIDLGEVSALQAEPWDLGEDLAVDIAWGFSQCPLVDSSLDNQVSSVLLSDGDGITSGGDFERSQTCNSSLQP